MSAPTLAELQRRFQAYVQGADSDVVGFVVADARADAAQRMDVYYRAYRLRLLEVLEQDFPALAAVAGAERFVQLGRAYIDAHPSRRPSVRWFGEGLAAFLRATAPAEPLLAELAAFEWAQGEAFDALDGPVLAVDDVAQIPGEDWPDMCFTSHPSLRRLQAEWNVGAIAQAVDDSAPVPAALRGPGVPWALWRHDLVVRWRSLGDDEAAALDAVCAGANFGEMCELLCEHVDPDMAGLHAASLLKRWLVDGLLSSVRAR
jgi:Putative DNA-binding domain